MITTRTATTFIALVAAGALGRQLSAGLVLRTYVAGMDSTWNVNANWNPFGVPNNAGLVEYHAIIDDGHVVSLDANAMVTSLTLINGSQLWIGNSDTFSLWGATAQRGGSNVYNQGTLRIYSEGSNTNLRINGGPVTFTGAEGGEVVMEAGIGAGNSVIFGTGGSTSSRLINGEGHTFRGAGFFENSLNLTNHGVISADNASKALEIRVPSMTLGGDCTNDGTLRAENGATLKLLRTGTSIVAQYLNDDGVIEALDGSTVQLDGLSWFVGGELKSSGTGEIHCIANQCALKNLTNSAQLHVNHNVAGHFVGSIVNDGTIWLDGVAPGFCNFTVTSAGDVTLSGGGTIELGDNPDNRILSNTGNPVLFTNVDNLIRGGGNLGDNGLRMKNQGIIDASSNVTAMKIDPPGSGGEITNEGEIRVTGTAGLVIDAGAFTNTGTVIVNPSRALTRSGTYQQNGGSTVVNGTMTVTGGSFGLSGGALLGGGTVTGTVSNTGGTVAPGNSAGILSIVGTYVQGAGGTMAIELNGTTVGSQYDRLTVSGIITLGGTLHLALGFIPIGGEQFTIVTSTAGTISGAFSAVTGIDGATVIVSSTNVVVTLPAPSVPGDLDGDGAVNGADLAMVLGSWGPCPEPPAPCTADLDGDGFVNGADLAILLGSWTG